MTHKYDIIIFGSGVAGLYLANRLKRAGYNLIVIEKDKLGGVQTLASQGMIHGGQKYAIHGAATEHTAAAAAMVDRWDACFEGIGDIDLPGVRLLSRSQFLFPAGGFFSRVAPLLAALAVKGWTKRVANSHLPDSLYRSPVYEMHEKVVETKSLVEAMARNLKGRILKGEATELLPDGQVAVSGIALQAEAIVFAAGAGNETALELLRVTEKMAQRRPLRQVMVRSLPYALYGHGIEGKPKPRVTVTSHPDGRGEWIWYLGGGLAEEGAKMEEEHALYFAKQEMREIFPHIEWEKKEWATWVGDRAEPLDAGGELPAGAVIQQRGKVLIAWPVKLTFAPALADKMFEWLVKNNLAPSLETPPPPLPEPEMGTYPWEGALWEKL